MTTEPKALRLANDLDIAINQTDAEDDVIFVPRWTVKDSAAELRRLHALNQELLEALKHGCPPDCKDGMTDSGGVHPWGEPALIPCPTCAAITKAEAA